MNYLPFLVLFFFSNTIYSQEPMRSDYFEGVRAKNQKQMDIAIQNYKEDVNNNADVVIWGDMHKQCDSFLTPLFNELQKNKELLLLEGYAENQKYPTNVTRLDVFNTFEKTNSNRILFLENKYDQFFTYIVEAFDPYIQALEEMKKNDPNVYKKFLFDQNDIQEIRNFISKISNRYIIPQAEDEWIKHVGNRKQIISGDSSSLFLRTYLVIVQDLLKDDFTYSPQILWKDMKNPFETYRRKWTREARSEIFVRHIQPYLSNPVQKNIIIGQAHVEYVQKYLESQGKKVVVKMCDPN